MRREHGGLSLDRHGTRRRRGSARGASRGRIDDRTGRGDFGRVWNAARSSRTWSRFACAAPVRDRSQAGRTGLAIRARCKVMNDTVLIVDDSLTVRMDLANAFEQAGFKTL